MTTVLCQHCGEYMEVTDETPGAEATCPNCGKITWLARPQRTAPAPAKPKLTIPPISEAKLPTPQEVSTVAREFVTSVEKVIVGKHDQVVLAIAALFAEGHLLIEDVPGVAKTMLGRAIAQSAGCSFKRIQCTPDLQPSDILGESFSDPETGRPDFHFGPLFSQFVLVDEINRANPRTQAALLEALGEGSISAGRITYKMAEPFMVIATQNPIEQEGTFLLPEAQKDRFLVRLTLGYPELSDEKEMCERFQLGHPIETLKPVTSPDRIISCQRAVREMHVGSDVCDYVLALVRATREHPALRLGASPRGSLGLFRMAQAMAAIEGKDSVSIEQVRSMARVVLGHRLIIKPDQKGRYRDGGEVISEIIAASKTAGHP